jgi:stigma-specific protein Stig1
MVRSRVGRGAAWTALFATVLLCWYFLAGREPRPADPSAPRGGRATSFRRLRRGLLPRARGRSAESPCQQNGKTLCNGACVDPSTDPANCGACGHRCEGDQECLGGTCLGGDCRLECGDRSRWPNRPLDAPGATAGVCCNRPGGEEPRGCTDLATDNWNCGGCGVTCEPNTRCQKGQCVCQGAICDEHCTPIMIDGNNCGSCGARCPQSAPVCAEGVCLSCEDVGKTACEGLGCILTTRDPRHCGSCGNACPGEAACIDGVCVTVRPECDVACPGLNGLGPRGVCCRRPWGRDDPGCTDPLVDSLNCGACGHVCRQGERCDFGTCRAGPG